MQVLIEQQGALPGRVELVAEHVNVCVALPAHLAVVASVRVRKVSHLDSTCWLPIAITSAGAMFAQVSVSDREAGVLELPTSRRQERQVPR